MTSPCGQRYQPILTMIWLLILMETSNYGWLSTLNIETSLEYILWHIILCIVTQAFEVIYLVGYPTSHFLCMLLRLPKGLPQSQIQMSLKSVSHVSRFQEYWCWRCFWFTAKRDALWWRRRIPTRRCIRCPLREIQPFVSHKPLEKPWVAWELINIFPIFLKVQCPSPASI